jgi:hypothetical protein
MVVDCNTAQKNEPKKTPQIPSLINLNLIMCYHSDNAIPSPGVDFMAYFGCMI